MSNYQDKFDDLFDLPISEELLGAYIEGSLRGSEFREVQNLLSDDLNLSELMDCVEKEISYDLYDSIESFDGDFRPTGTDEFIQSKLENFELPIIGAELFISAPALSHDYALEEAVDGIIEHNSNIIDDCSILDEDPNNNDLLSNTGMNDNF